MRDVTLIVVSILIAFALDASWDSMLERRASDAQASALRGELVSAQRRLMAMSEALGTALVSTEAVLSLMSPQAAGPQIDTLLGLLGGSLNFGFPDLRGSVVSEVLESGNPVLTRDPSLVRDLEEWSARVADLSMTAEHLERNRDVDLQTALIGAGFPGFAVASAGPLGLPPSSFPLDSGRVVRSTAVYAAFYYRAFRMRLMGEDVEDLRELTDSIIGQIDRLAGQDAG